MQFSELDDDLLRRIVAVTLPADAARIMRCGDGRICNLARENVNARLAIHHAKLQALVEKLPPRAREAAETSLKPCKKALVSLNLVATQLCGKDGFNRGVFTLTGLTALTEYLKVDEFLTTIHLGGNSIGDDGAVLLSSAIKENRALTHLSVAGSRINYVGATALSQALNVNTGLRTFSLLNNNIGIEGTRAFSRLLVGNRTLTDLDLSDAKLHGIAPLARVLAATALSTFSIALNDIGDGGALLIAETLKDNTVLKHIDLEANHIGPEGGVAIAEALRGNAVLKSINLEYNGLGDEGKGAIRDAVSGRVGFELKM